MLYREIIAVCPEISKKHINTLHVWTVHQQYQGTVLLLLLLLLLFSAFLHRVPHTCTAGWYAAITLTTSVTTST